MQEQIEKLRHTSAHVVAQAMLSKYPNAKMGIGPVTDQGFYYDFLIDSIDPETIDKDKLFNQLEQEINRIIEAELPLSQQILAKEEAINMLYQQGQIFKTEIIQQLPQPEVSFYKTGNEFIDLCRGPHLEHTGQIGGIKLTSITTVNWLNDENRPEMVRIKGLAFDSKAKLEEYVNLQEQIKDNNHLKIGNQMKIFTSSHELIILNEKGINLIENIINSFSKLLADLEFNRYDLPDTIPLATKLIEDHNLNKNHDYLTITNSVGYLQSPKLLASTVLEKQYDEKKPPKGLFTIFTNIVNTTGVKTDNFLNYYIDKIIWGYQKIENEDILKSQLRILIQGLINKYSSLLKTQVSLRITTTKSIEQKINLENIIKDLGIDIVKKYVEEIENKFTVELIYQDPLEENWEVANIELHGHTKEYHLETKISTDIYRLIALLLEKYQGLLPREISPNIATIIPRTEEYIGYAKQVMKDLNELGVNTSYREISDSTFEEEIESAKAELYQFMLVVGEHEQKNNVISVKPLSGKELGLMKIEEFLHKVRQID